MTYIVNTYVAVQPVGSRNTVLTQARRLILCRCWDVRVCLEIFKARGGAHGGNPAEAELIHALQCKSVGAPKENESNALAKVKVKVK